MQLRAKRLDGAAFLDLASRIVEDTRAAGGSLIVNDRADVARLAGAAGVHVGQDDLSPADVRAIVGPDVMIGVSAHSPHQIARAVDAPVSYLAIGPVFRTATKDTGYDAVGLSAVRHAHTAVRARGLPVVAIGGITLANAVDVVNAGAAAVAVITDLLQGDPEARVRQYLSVLA